MDSIKHFHIQRLRAATVNKLSMEHIPEWLCQNTFLNDAPYSFKDHEYQQRILRDTSPDINIRKCAQIGCSELSSRWALAMVGMTPNHTVIYTLPTASFGAVFMSTRINPIIQSSPFLSAAVSNETDNSSVKRFGQSYFYVKGSAATNAAISVPAHTLIHDEVDFSDPTVISSYQSRLRHAENPRTIKLSTPTAPGIGIDAAFNDSRRFFSFVKCNHCNHQFIPDYYQHVVIPGFKGDLRSLTAQNLGMHPWKEGHVACPSCGKQPSLQPEHREWVCENPSENHNAVGYQVSPFDAPNVMRVPQLISESTRFSAASVDFMNFALGLPAEDKESVITREELERALIPSTEIGNASFVMGMDMGLVCWATIMAIRPDGQKIIVHTEGIPVADVRRRRKELAMKYRIRLSVCDIFPYTETILAMQEEDRNLFGAVYVQGKGLLTHTVVDKDEERSKAALSVRQVNINRNKAFDVLMDDIKVGHILKLRDDNDEVWIRHMTDMKRIKHFDSNDEISYVWKKTDKGEDHLHHSLLYASIASQMLGVSHGLIVLPSLTYKFRVKSQI